MGVVEFVINFGVYNICTRSLKKKKHKYMCHPLVGSYSKLLFHFIHTWFVGL